MQNRWPVRGFTIAGAVIGLAMSALFDWPPFSAELPESDLVMIWAVPAVAIAAIAAIAASLHNRRTL
jgi:tellurite resistance protein TehA-like permease